MNHKNTIPSDGYTEPGYVAERPGLHGELRFVFRPMLVEDQSKIMRALEKASNDGWAVKAARVVADRVREWSLTEPIKAEQVLRLKPALFSRLYGIVLGTDASDIDPQWPTEQKAEAVEDDIDALLAGKTAGAAREERNEKNSGAA